MSKHESAAYAQACTHLATTTTTTTTVDTSAEGLNQYLSKLVGGALETLQEAGCVTLEPEAEGGGVEATPAGRIASFYYLDHHTMAMFAYGLRAGMGLGDVLQVRPIDHLSPALFGEEEEEEDGLTLYTVFGGPAGAAKDILSITLVMVTFCNSLRRACWCRGRHHVNHA